VQEVCGAPKEAAGMQLSFHYLAAFPPAQAQRGDRVPAARALAGEQERYL